MREETIKRNSRKRLNALILLVAFTAILLIVATYAWFSTQRNVTLSGLEGRVNVAEGLQISLDALNWANEIDLSNGAQAYFAQTNTDLGLTEPDQMRTLTSPYEGRTNLVPSELLPVSTTAQTGEGIGLTDFNMYSGEVQSGNQLLNIAKAAAEADSGYYAIDFFLQNSSSTDKIAAWDAAVEESSDTTGLGDLLQLQPNSSIRLDEPTSESTGFQNTFRVAFAIYDDDGSENALVNNTQVTQTEILAATTGGSRLIQDAAIWEPNASGAQQGSSPSITKYAAHVNYVVQNNNKLTLSSGDQTAAGLSSTSRFAADTKLPTYALTAASKDAELIPTTEPETFDPGIADIYNWDTGATAAGLVKQNTLQTANTGLGADPVQLISADDGTTQIEIAPGRYVHMRMYIWLEGQDVDCINYASLGGGVTIDIGLSKPGSDADGVGG